MIKHFLIFLHKIKIKEIKENLLNLNIHIQELIRNYLIFLEN